MKRKTGYRTLTQRLSLEHRFSSLAQLRRFQPYVSSQLQNTLRKLAIGFALLNVIIASVALIGWHYDIPVLRRVFTNLPDIQTNAAIAVMLSSIAMLLALWKQERFLIRFLRYIFSLLVVLIGLLTVIQYTHGFNFWIDEVLYKELPGVTNSVFPNRMEPNTAVIFVLIGLSILFLDKRVLRTWVYQLFVLIAALLLLPTIVGYVYNIEFIYGIATNTEISLPATIAFILLVLTIVFSRPKRGIMQLLTSDSAGGFLTRRLTIIAFIIPMLLGWIIMQGNISGFYDAEFRYLLLVVSTIVVFTFLIWRNAKSLHAIDENRKKNENNIFFLAQVSKVLSASLDFKTTLRNLAQLSVPAVSDWCSIDIFDKKGKITQAAIYHADQKVIAHMKQIRKMFPPNPVAKNGIAYVMREGKSEYLPNVTDSFLQEISRNNKHFSLLKKLRFVSVIIVPISVHKKIIGGVTLATAESRRVFTKADLFIAEELASRAALAIENTQLYKGAQDAIRLRDEFISVASHELKTPLTSLKVYAQILQRQLMEKKNKTLLTYVNRMEKQVDHLTDLVKDLLDMSRMQMGKLHIKQSFFDFYELVSEISQSIQSTTTDHVLELESHITEQVYGDRERIGQIVINLITNAIKYSPDADKVEIALLQREKSIILAVRDFGIGIDKKHQKRIFEKFYQVADTVKKSSAGLGIGLYVSSDIASRHKGSITVESERDKGATFYLTLPRKRNAPKI